MVELDDEGNIAEALYFMAEVPTMNHIPWELYGNAVVEELSGLGHGKLADSARMNEQNS